MLRYAQLALSFSLVFISNPTFAQQPTEPASCLEISAATPLVEQYVFDPPDPETLVTNLLWSPDGSSIIASYVDEPVTDRSERIRQWDLATSDNTIVFSRIDEPYAVTGSWGDWSPNGTKLALNSDGTVQIVNLGDDSIISLEDNPMWGTGLVWSPDSSQLATIQSSSGSNTNGDIRIWDAHSGELEHTLDARDLFPDFHAAWTDRGLRWITQDEDRTVRVWEAGNNQSIFILEASYEASTVWLSPDGEMLAAKDDFVELWNIDTRELIQTLEILIYDLAWSPDENCIATATYNPGRTNLTNPQIWNIETGELLQTIEATLGKFSGVAWSPNGTSLAYIDENGSIHIWGLPLS